MVYTRSQKETVTAARTLVSLKHSTTRMARLMATLMETKDREPTDAQFWSNWTTWFHTFVSEVQDEAMTSKGVNRFVEAERRWSSFCAKKLRCDVKYVESWLKFSDVNQRLSVAGF
jgi:hypothetical protein